MEIFLQGLYYGLLVAAAIAVVYMFSKLTIGDIKSIRESFAAIRKTRTQTRAIEAETRAFRADREALPRQKDEDSHG